MKRAIGLTGFLSLLGRMGFHSVLGFRAQGSYQ